MVGLNDAGQHIPGVCLLRAEKVVDEVAVASFPDPGAGGSVVFEIFADELERTVDAGEEILGHDPDELAGEEHEGGFARAVGEEVAQALDGFNNAGAVESGEDEVARFGGSEGELGGFFVPDFADHDDVGVLPKGGTEGSGEAVGIGVEFPLREVGLLVLEDIFDGVLEGDDVTVEGLV